MQLVVITLVFTTPVNLPTAPQVCAAALFTVSLCFSTTDLKHYLTLLVYSEFGPFSCHLFGCSALNRNVDQIHCCLN